MNYDITFCTGEDINKLHECERKHDCKRFDCFIQTKTNTFACMNMPNTKKCKFFKSKDNKVVNERPNSIYEVLVLMFNKAKEVREMPIKKIVKKPMVKKVVKKVVKKKC